MKTAMHIYRPEQPVERRTVEFRTSEPTYAELKAVILPLLDGASNLEHVAVLWNDRRSDMFVDDIGQQKRLPRNEGATTIYRNNWLTRHPGEDPESIPYIYGPAVLFDEIVWS